MSNIWSKPHSVNLSFHPICRDMSLNFLSGEWLCDILIKQFRQVLEYRFSTHGANNFPHTARIWCLFLSSFPMIGQSVSQWPLNEIFRRLQMQFQKDIPGWKYVILSLVAGLNLGLRLANGRHRHKVTSSLIGWAHTMNQPWSYA